MKMRRPAIWLALLAGAACGPEPVTVSLSELDDGIARFDVHNPSTRDVESIDFEVTHRSEDGLVVRVDTVTYQWTANPLTCEVMPWVRAGERTSFTWRVPPDGVSAAVAVLQTTYFESNAEAGESPGRWCPDG